MPSYKLEDIPRYSKWKDGIHQNEITEEMRNERNKIIQMQGEVRKRNFEKSRIREQQIEYLKQNYVNSLNIDSDVIETMKSEHCDVLHYDYEKIEEI